MNQTKTKQIKPIKAWAIVTRGELNWFFKRPEIYYTRKNARESLIGIYDKVIPVLITPIIK